MVDQWYYWCESDVLGPFTGQQLADLAAAGTILPTDTIWKDGVEAGVQASKVHNLFPAATEAPVAVAAPPAAVVAEAAPTAAVAPGWGSVNQPTGHKLRATAGKGAIIVGQDGKTVKFRKKCTTCGFEDSSWKCIPITRGTSRHSFYCPKCRKGRHVEVNGM